MLLSPRISALVHAFREAESDAGRGPHSKELALALEEQLAAPGVSDAMLLDCFGPPDLWDESGNKALFVYFYDEKEAGRNGDEWCFVLEDGKVTNSGFNERGINDLSGLRTRDEWPSKGTP